jgi:hypothetical protein
MLGFTASPRATPTRCCCPPDSWLGYRSASPRSSPTVSRSSNACAWASLRGTPLSSGTVATLSMTLRCGSRPEFCMTYPMVRRSSTGFTVEMSSPSISIWPLLGSTIRLIIRRRVVFPHPEEPTNTVVLRDGMMMLKSSTACVPSGKVLLTWRNSIMGTYGSFLVATHGSTLAKDKAKHYSAPLSPADW